MANKTTRKRQNWDVIKRVYIEGIPQDNELYFPTLEEISKTYNIPHSTTLKRCAKDDWTTQREMYRAKLEERSREKRIEALASKQAEFDADIFKVAQAGLMHIQGHFLKAQDKLKASKGKEPLAIHTLDSLSKSLERYQRIGRLALGEPTEITHGQESDTDRYELVQEIIADPELARKIEANFQRRIGDGTGTE